MVKKALFAVPFTVSFPSLFANVKSLTGVVAKSVSAPAAIKEVFATAGETRFRLEISVTLSAFVYAKSAMDTSTGRPDLFSIL